MLTKLFLESGREIPGHSKKHRPVRECFCYNNSYNWQMTNRWAELKSQSIAVCCFWPCVGQAALGGSTWVGLNSIGLHLSVSKSQRLICYTLWWLRLVLEVMMTWFGLVFSDLDSNTGDLITTLMSLSGLFKPQRYYTAAALYKHTEVVNLWVIRFSMIYLGIPT